VSPASIDFGNHSSLEHSIGMACRLPHSSSGGTVESFGKIKGENMATWAGPNTDVGTAGDRKKRSRNQDQMEHNRVAQQKYR
jgi:hypothetical protein